MKRFCTLTLATLLTLTCIMPGCTCPADSPPKETSFTDNLLKAAQAVVLLVTAYQTCNE